MAKEKSDWDSIPSLDGLQVDWEFEPENELGKRAKMRLDRTELHSQLGVKNIPARVVASDYDETGYLADVSVDGGAVVLSTDPNGDRQVKIGFLLGQRKVVAGAVVKNVVARGKGFRVGFEFLDLSKESEEYITGLFASKGFKEY